MDRIAFCYDPAFPSQAVSYTGTAGSSTAYPPGPRGVYVVSTTDCYVIVGEGVTATTALGGYVPAYTPMVLHVNPGAGTPWRVSAIRVSADGTLYVKPVQD